MSPICTGPTGTINPFGECQNFEKRKIVRKRFDLDWAVRWTYVPFQRIVNHINGRHASKITAVARIYASTDSHHMFANVRTNRTHDTAKKVRGKNKQTAHCPLHFIDQSISLAGEFPVNSRPTSSIDYELPDAHDDDSDDSDSSDNSSIARIVIIATAVLGVLLIVVLCAILCK